MPGYVVYLAGVVGWRSLITWYIRSVCSPASGCARPWEQNTDTTCTPGDRPQGPRLKTHKVPHTKLDSSGLTTRRVFFHPTRRATPTDEFEKGKMATPEEIDHSLDGDSRVAEICAILSVGCALTTAVVGLRIYTRTRLIRAFGFDDAFMLAAQTLAIGTAVAIGLGAYLRAGTPATTEPPPDILLTKFPSLSRNQIWTWATHVDSTRGIPNSLRKGTLIQIDISGASLLIGSVNPPRHSTHPSSSTMSACALPRSQSCFNIGASSPASSCNG